MLVPFDLRKDVIEPLKQLSADVGGVKKQLTAHVEDHRATVKLKEDKKKNRKDLAKNLAIYVGGPLLLAVVARVLGAPIG